MSGFDPIGNPTFGMKNAGDLLLDELRPLADANGGKGRLYNDSILLAWFLIHDPRAAVAASMVWVNPRTHEVEQTCGITVWTGYQRIGVAHPRIPLPYLGHTDVLTLIVDAATKANAWETFAKGAPMPTFEAGCVAMLGDGGAGGSEHVDTVESQDGDTLTVIAGGQPGVARFQRKLVQIGGRWFLERPGFETKVLTGISHTALLPLVASGGPS